MAAGPAGRFRRPQYLLSDSTGPSYRRDGQEGGGKENDFGSRTTRTSVRFGVASSERDECRLAPSPTYFRGEMSHPASTPDFSRLPPPRLDNFEGASHARHSSWQDPSPSWAFVAPALKKLATLTKYTDLVADSHYENWPRQMARYICGAFDYSLCVEPERRILRNRCPDGGQIHYLRRVIVDGTCAFDGVRKPLDYWESGTPVPTLPLKTERLKRILVELLLRGHRVTVLLPQHFLDGSAKADDPNLLRTLRAYDALEFCNVSRWYELFEYHLTQDYMDAPVLLASSDLLRLARLMLPQQSDTRSRSWGETALGFLTAIFVGRKAPTVSFVTGSHRIDAKSWPDQMFLYPFRSDEGLSWEGLSPREYHRRRHAAQLDVESQLGMLSYLLSDCDLGLPYVTRRHVDVFRRAAWRLYKKHVEGIVLYDELTADDDGWGRERQESTSIERKSSSSLATTTTSDDFVMPEPPVYTCWSTASLKVPYFFL